MSEIVFVTRTDERLHFGGDTVQSLAMETYLLDHGYRVRRAVKVDTTVSPDDLVVLMNLTRPIEAYANAVVCTKRRIKYILFPVYWDLDSLGMDAGPKQRLKNLLSPRGRDIIRILKKVANSRRGAEWKILMDHRAWNTQLMGRYVLENAAYVCPNSVAEWEHIIKTFDARLENVRVVHNGVLVGDHEMDKVPNSVAALLPDPPYILCMGAIGPRKNQLTLVRATKETGTRVVILGGVAPGSQAYAQSVRREAGHEVMFIPAQTHGVAMAILRMAKGHVQPSFIETPGLASLEAAALGLPIGVADVPPVREYFAEHAYYCDPHGVDSVARMLRSMQQDPGVSEERSLYITRRYSWDRALKPLGDLVDEMGSDQRWRRGDE
jgi:glycosyltransferase involved in cell wall biosynthesis